MDKRDEQSMKNLYEFVGRWHEGQTDRGGQPYINHLKYVGNLSAKVAQEMGKDNEFVLKCFVLGLCHDLLEDTKCNIKDIQNFLYHEEIANAYFLCGHFEKDLNLLTRKEGEGYFGYIERISESEVASLVKMIDLIHNSDVSRIPNPTEEDYRRVAKYHVCQQILDDKWHYTDYDIIKKNETN